MLKRVGTERWEMAATDAEQAFFCQDLALALDGKSILGPLSFDLPATGITAILGPNGAGKSCLMRLMHGLMAPSAGIAGWGATPAGDGSRKAQAMVFQTPVLLRRSVRANLDYVLTGPRATRDGQIAALLELVGLSGHDRTPARRLSGGEQQRLALARALAVEPRVLLLDEPTASLDPASVHIIETILDAQRAAGTKIVLVTHDMAQARRLADDVVFLHRGQMLEQGPAAAFFESPQSTGARAYLAGQIII